MSRGLGQIEQEILALIEEEGEDRPYAAEELANAIYRPNAGDDGCCTRAQKVSTIRAMHSVARKYSDRVALTDGKGRAPLRIRNITAALRRLQREQGLSSHVFVSERDGPMTPKSFHALFGRIGVWAKMPFPIHPHMLRHGCGYALANAGHDTRALQAWLGHRNIQHTVRYTELAPDRFKNFWR